MSKSELIIDHLEGIALAVVIGVFVAAATNFVWDYIPQVKDELFFFSSLMFVVVLALPGLKRHPGVLYLILAIIAIPFMLRGISSLSRSGDSNAQFQHRVTQLLNNNRRLYESRLLNEDLYGFVKSKAGRLFVPGLVDSEHWYESLEVDLAHIGQQGITEYRYQGHTYGDVPVPITFSCSGERRLDGAGLQVRVYAPYDSTTTSPETVGAKDKGESFLYVGRIPLESCDFEVARVTYAGDVMKQSEEGFIVDLRNIVHPPTTFQIRVLSDSELDNLTLWRLEPRALPFHRRLIDWMLMRPRYSMKPISRAARVVQQPKEELERELERLRARTERPDLELSSSAWSIPAIGDCERNVFLIRYHPDLLRTVD